MEFNNLKEEFNIFEMNNLAVNKSNQDLDGVFNDDSNNTLNMVQKIDTARLRDNSSKTRAKKPKRNSSKAKRNNR